MAKYEVTQELYELVMGKNPAKWRGPRNSVEMITWDDANTFCAKVTALLRQEKLIGDKEVIRLPSEAEWEYAAGPARRRRGRSATTPRTSATYSLVRQELPRQRSAGRQEEAQRLGSVRHARLRQRVVRRRLARPLKGARPTAPAQEKDEKDRVIRGGSFADAAEKHRSAYRDHKPGDHKSDRVGFRCVKSKEVEK